MAALNSSQVLILQTLARNSKGLPISVLTEKSGAACTADNLGPVLNQTLGNHPTSLYGMGFVKASRRVGEEVVWRVTAAGTKAAGQYKTIRRSNGNKVPADKLDPVVIQFKNVRTYGFEMYTDTDLQEIRAQLGEEHKDIKLSDLRLQIIARRKQGAFTDPTEKIRKAAEQAIRYFGPEGIIKAKLLTDAQVEKLTKMASA